MIGRFAVRWLAIVIAVVVAAQLLPQQIQYSTFEGLAVFALILGLLNTFVRPVLKVLTFPLTILTLGLFSLILNALLFLFAASITGSLSSVGTVTVSGFIAALIAALIVSVVGTIVGWIA
jgi:putative membrane protein